MKNRKNIVQRLALAGAFLAMTGATAFAQSDITGVVDTLDTYRTSAMAVGVAVLLFVLGRSIVRKIAK